MNKKTRQIIPLRRYLGVRAAHAPSYSADDQTLYFLSNLTGFSQVWSKSPANPWPQQITFFLDRVLGVHASPRGEYICVSADQGGNERAQLFLMNTEGSENKNLTQDPHHIYHFGAWSPDGLQFTYSSNKRDGQHFDLYLYDVHTDSHRTLFTSDHTNYASRFSPDQRYILFSRSHTNMTNDLFLLDLTSGKHERITSFAENDTQYRMPHFSPDGDLLYLLSNRNSQFLRVAAYHLQTKQWVWLTDDQWDAEHLSLSRNGQYLAFAVNEGGTSRLHIINCETSKRITLPSTPAGVISELTWNHQSNSLAFTLSSPSHATEIWTIQMNGNQLERATYASISGVPASTYIEPELIHYPSFDGLEIPAFYYRPSHVKGPYPVLVYVHGGPESQSRNGFNSLLQYFLQLGMAILVPNVRGSSGYGRTYVHLDDVRKRMDSVADLNAGVDWLISKGNANRDAIAVMGGSYGGFMVLAALTHYPERWAAGVDVVGISNFRTFIQNTSSYRRHLRESEYGSIEKDGQFFDQISPIHHVDRIQAPLFVIHGANDPRVPVAEAEQIVTSLKERKMPVQYLRFEDEGHGLAKYKNRLEAYTQVADFLQEWVINKV
ncbi:S9 family peptidase [Mechercharimyces sp. CAU 1602]|uniref:S9 family peptidase n=1 Tax=Mechercharimyces sp. CAU 1602 TaxID=2973933 RepID=UPI0021627FC6|nr:S9 family peptidase [Mechercharimyces sp. CAU 1602]MCS1352067.1 S9 family peptidase [Mechercharimyces sp. CAU 1602]